MSGAGARRPTLPYLVSRMLFVGAALAVAQFLWSGVAWIESLVDLYSTVLIPIDAGSPGVAVFLLIIGAALARRKRAAWVITVVALALIVLTDLVTVVVLLAPLVSGPPGSLEVAPFARFGINLACLGLLLTWLVVDRREFRARRPPGNLRRAVLTLAVGLVVTFGVGWLLVTAFPSGLTSPRGRLAWVAERVALSLLAGDQHLIPRPLEGPAGWINTVVNVLAGLSLVAALLVLVRSQRAAALVDPEDEPHIRALVAQSPDDSLAYFATRRDKSVVFAPDGGAAVLYRVELGVCLASSDPIGPPEHWPGAIQAWRDLVDTYGWTPAVLGASEHGATAYARWGLRVIRLGDEAILETGHFSLERREMAPVRHAVRRLERMGYRVRVRRHRDIGPDEMAVLISKTAEWRDSETERGFSMALGRLGDPLDGDCLMVEAIFPPGRGDPGPAGEIAGILSFVPWGHDGLSLDIMRRSPAGDNGVNEFMVAGLMAAARDVGVLRISLNFAVFRSAFEEGGRIGAGPVLRLWRRLLLVASRWWQIESLYRSNVKYRPDWHPRFLCFAESRDIALVGAASGLAEGFIDLPAFLRRHRSRTAARPLPPGPAAAAAAVALDAAGRVAQAPGAEARRVPEQVRARLAVRDRLLSAGVDPYPPSWQPSRTCASLRLGAVVKVAGRVLNVRDLGGVIFVRVRDWSGDAQLMLTRATTGPESMTAFRRTVDLGDHVGAEGRVVLSRSGQLSVEVTAWLLTSKTLRPLPDKHRGLTDPESRVRQRYLDLTVNPSSRQLLMWRATVVAAVRDGLRERGYLEVETPILQTRHGGANARPFRTHINAYDMPLYLRIAPELHLKRLLVGGVDRVFEIGRNFRNEGADSTHNPEFTMLEAYRAYADYTTMRLLAQDLIRGAARAAFGTTVIAGRDHAGTVQEVDLAEPWPVLTVHEAVGTAVGTEVTADTSREELLTLGERRGVPLDRHWGRGAILLELYEHLVERTTVRPTFYSDFPSDVSPLTRPHRHDSRLAERWDLVAFGAEIGTAYSELVDPVVQRERLTAQALRAAGGDAEAMELDEDFLLALEHGMPPSGGLGMGLDRLMMLLTGTSIRETIAFPLVRPPGGGRG